MLRLITYIFFSGLYLSANLYSQEIVFGKILPEHGLSQINVLAIHQDSRGFMWFGTQEGLNMYDGYNFKVFRKSVFEKNSIASNLIIDITEDHNQNIWIATQDNGINIYNPITDKMDWVGNSEKNPHLISDNRIQRLLCDSKNRIWVATNKGVDCIIQSDSGTNIITVNENLNPDEQNKQHAFQITETKKGEILIVRVNAITKVLFDEYDKPVKGVELWFRDKEIFGYHTLMEINNDFILGTTAGIYLLKHDKDKQMKIVSLINTANIYALAIDKDKNLWAGGSNGLYFYKYDYKKPDYYTLHSHIKEGYSEFDISSKFVRDIFIDNHQTVWIATQGGGINKYNSRLRQFRKYYHSDEKGSLSNNKIQAIHEDIKGNIWIGTTGGGLSMLPENNNKNYKTGFTKIDINESEQQNYVYCITDFIRNGEHVVLSGNCYAPQLTELTYKNGKWHKQNPDIKLWSYANTVHYDKYGYLWLGTHGAGIYKAKLVNNKYKYKQYNTQNSDIPSDVIRSIFEDSKGRIWIGTDNGLGYISEYDDSFDFPETKIIRHEADNATSLTENYVLKITETANGEIWIGTGGGGINILGSDFDGSSFKFRNISMNDGLPNNMISEILEDKNKNIWISSNMGISLYNTSDSIIRNYNISNGLQGYAFVDNGGCVLKDGELLFGGSQGFNAFYPDEITTDTTSSNIVFTKFELLNNVINAGDIFKGRVLLEKDINATEEIVLKHKENSFKIHFASLNYLSPENNKYKYKLYGFDQEWNEVSSENRFAKYTNLDPGTYRLIVKASNSDGAWDSKQRVITITVETPIHNTIWFKSITILIAILLIIVFYYFRLKAEKTKNEILEYAVQKRTEEINKKNLALNESNVMLEEQKEEIDSQKNELEKHRNHLEVLIEERTYELGKALKKAKESDLLKTAFLANMSHEIRTPMNAIIGFSELLELSDISPEEKTEYINIVKSNSRTLLKLINDIIDLSVIESDQLNIVEEEFCIGEMVKGLFAHYSLNKKKENIEYILNITEDAEKLNINSDEIRIKQVITNFMDNAYKFTSWGTIELGAHIENSSLYMYVKDSGRGIPKDQLGYIFNRFTKIEKSNQNWEKGLGLGLAISERIATALGGNINVSSEEGKGSEFCFLLPIKKAASN